MPRSPGAPSRRSPSRQGRRTAQVLKPSKHQQTRTETVAADRGSAPVPLRTHTFQFHRNVSTLSAIAVFVLLAANVLVVRASLTFTSTGITSDGVLNVTANGTSTFDFGSSTFNLHTVNGGPISTGNGLFTIGNLLVKNTSTILGSIVGSSTNGSASLSGFTVNGVLNVKAYGAKCDGVTDDNVSLQNALNAVDSAHQEVFIPGTCATSIALLPKSNTWIGGAGNRISQLKLTSGANVDTNVITLSNVQNVTVSDIEISGSGKLYDTASSAQAKGDCIYIDGSGIASNTVGAVVQRTYMTQCHDMVSINDAINVKILDNDFVYAHRGRAAVEGRGVQQLMVSSNHFEDTNVATNTSGLGPVNAIYIYGGDIVGLGNTIVGNTVLNFEAPGWEDFDLWIQNSTVVGNVINGNSRTKPNGTSINRVGINSVFNVNTPTDHNTISNNIITNREVGITVGIQGGQPGFAQAMHDTIDGNTIQKTVTAAISVNSSGPPTDTSDLHISNNIIDDVNDLGSTTNTAGWGILLEDCDRCSIEGNHVRNTSKAGIGIFDGEAGFSINNNVVSLCGQNSTTFGNGIDASGLANTNKVKNGVISGNFVTKCSGNGIYVAYASDVVVANNIAVDNGTSDDGASNKFGNIVLTNSSTRIMVVGNAAYATATSTNASYGISISNPTDVVIRANNLWQNKTTNLFFAAGTNTDVMLGENVGVVRLNKFAQTSSYTATLLDQQIVVTDPSTGNQTIQLPAVAQRKNQPLCVKNLMATSSVIVTVSGADLMCDTSCANANLTVAAAGHVACLDDDGTQWYVTSKW